MPEGLLFLPICDEGIGEGMALVDVVLFALYLLPPFAIVGEESVGLGGSVIDFRQA